MQNCIIHELESENGRGAIKTLYLSFIACFVFITKGFTKNLLLHIYFNNIYIISKIL